MLTRDEFQNLYEQGPDAVWAYIETLQRAAQTPLADTSALPIADKAHPDATEQDAARIREHLSHIPTNDPVCRITLALLRRGKQPDAAEIKALFASLYNTYFSFWRHRIVAVWALTQSPLTAKQRADLSRFLCDSLEKRSRLSLPPLLQVFMMGRAESDVQVNLAFLDALGQLRAPESIPTLAALACHTHSELRYAADCALLAALPALTAEHEGQFASETIPNLCRILTGARPSNPVASEALILAVLSALEKIGDGRAVSAVRHTSTYSYAPCQKEAKRILPTLLERQERERHSGMLLRASSPPDPNTDELVRPASYAADTSEELLRPLPASDIPDTRASS